MRFHLNYIPQKPGFQIRHSDKIFLLGSCFSENIATKLQEQRFPTHSNPNGILFNPLSLAGSLEQLLSQKPPDEKFMIERDGVFFSYQHHSSIHDDDKQDLKKKINRLNKAGAEFLHQTDYLFITFGSAFVYHHIALNEPVANCHKQPGSSFEKRLLTVQQITETYSELIKKLRTFNPKLKLVFTVSPVKYLKDGVVENNISKSTLLLSVHEFVKKFDSCFYFPAFELLNDDLRDYRFYKADLAHPNDLAIDYVWNKFSECFFSESTLLLNKQIQALNQALNHRKLIANSEEAIKLNDFILKQKELIRKTNPEIDFNH